MREEPGPELSASSFPSDGPDLLWPKENGEATLVIDPRGRVTAANRAAEELLGARPGAALRRLLGDDRAARRLRAARRAKRPLSARVAPADRPPLDVTYTPLEKGGLLILRPVVRPEPARWDPLARFGPLLDRLPLPWALLDSALVVRACNRPMARLADCTPEGLIGRPLASALVGVEAEDFARFDRRALAGEELGCIGHVQDRGHGDKRVLRTHRIRLPGPEPALLVLFEDVTEQFRTADGIAVDGRLVQTILDHMPGLISLKDAATRRFLFATGTERVIGDRPAHILLGRTAEELYEPELARRIEEAETTLLSRPGEVVDRRFPRVVDGERRWFFSRKLAVPDADGRPRYILTFNLDITREVAIEEALARANRFLDALFDTMPAMLAVRELASGRLVRVNPSFCRFLELTPEAVLGRPIDALAFGDPRARRADEAALVAGARIVAERMERVAGPEGARWLLTLEVLIRDEQGAPTHILSLHQDVTARLEAEKRLAQSRAFLETIVAHLPWALTVSDAATGDVLLANPAARDGLLSRLRSPSAADAVASALAALDRRLRAAPHQSIDLEIDEPDPQGRRWHRIRKVAVPQDDDPCRWILTLAEDVTERRQMLGQLQRSEAILRRSQAIAKLGSWRWVPGSSMIECSDELCRLLGLQSGPRMVALRALLRIVHREDRRKLRRLTASARDGLRRAPLLIRARCLDGHLRYLSVEAELVHEADDGEQWLLGTAQDVSERVEAEERMRYLALHDHLTGLPNRVLFDERLAAAVEAARRGQSTLALHCIDLNDFKGINDTLGHAAGDSLLREVAGRLQALVGPADLVARLGGDEFAILQREVTGPAVAAELAGRVIGALARPFRIDGQEVFTSASVGIALADGADLEPGDLLRQADIALFAAKAAGRGSFRFFSPELNARLSERKLIEARLRVALEARALELAFQPQFALRTGLLVGVEALVRWRDPELGVVPPDKFIPIAEDSSQILALGEIVLSEACAQAARWRRAGLPITRIAVNLSPAQFAYQDLVDTVARVLRATGLPPSALELEITESTLMRDRHGAITTLEALHALGVSVALDDFGTGYSSLSYLKRFPLDKIKIDRSFVADLPDDPDDVAIARTIITLGKTLGLTVLAEGVETPAQRDFLLREGCDEAQGYLFARPLTAAELETMLRERALAREV